MKSLLIILFSISIVNCSSLKKESITTKVVYQSDGLIITQISENAFQHTSFLQTNDFGRVACNGMIVRDSNEAIVFDTPTNDNITEELIQWITRTMQCKINAIIPTHFHSDCLGGLKAFDEKGIPSFAYVKTIELAMENHEVVPKNSFSDSLVLKVGNEEVVARFFGEGHTIDNVVGYFPKDHVLFGGCLIKEVNASKGYLGDANVSAWSGTVEKIKGEYRNIKIVIPGHGAHGAKELLDYTIDLFKRE